MAPVVSVIIPCYNYEQWVARAVRSALEQDWPAIEIIAVDDGSTDRTPEVLASFGDAIRVIRRPNGGLNAATSTGMAAATGEFITFLDADDEWRPDRCRLLAEALIAEPEAGLAYGDMEVIDTAGRTIVESFRQNFGLPAERGRVLGELLMGNFISAGALMVRSSLRERFHPIPEHAAWQDWWIASRVAEVADVVPITAAVNLYRHHESNMNLGKKGPAFIELCRTELRFRRWLLTTVDPRLATARQLVGGLAAYDHHIRTIADADRRRMAEVAPSSATEREQADASFREGLATLHSLGADAAVPALVRAAALMPEWMEVRLLLDDLLPIAMGETEAAPTPRELAVTVSVYKVLEDPELLGAWARTFDDSADISLIVTCVRETVTTDALIELAQRYSLDGPRAADIVTVEERHPAAVAARLGRPINAEIGSAEDVAALVAALGDRSPAAA